MKLKRYYTDKNLIVGARISLEGDEFHHLKNVMRARVGDSVVLFNGEKINAYGKIESLGKQEAVIFIDSIEENNSEPTIDVTLYQAVCKGEKLSLITQKITELGASEICVFYSDYTDIKDKTSKIDKLKKVTISACKQCGRSSLLKIDGVISFSDMVEKAKNNDMVFVAYENSNDETLYANLLKNANCDKIGLIIGAEGGFSEKEIEKLKENNFKIVTLGKRILRTETASIAGVSAIMFACEK